MHASTIIVEMENARQADWDDVARTITILADQIEELGFSSQKPRPQVIFAQVGDAADTPVLREGIEAVAPKLAKIAELDFVSVPDGRYYDLKNAGLKLAHGDPIVFLDSDCQPESGWLSALLTPFEKPDTIAVNGYTYLMIDDFASKVLALVWLFPLRANDEAFAAKRALNLNNCAFARDFIVNNPFPDNNGFKVSCTLLQRQLHGLGHRLQHVPARVGHPAPKGLRFFLWRALVTGRDADRKYTALKSERTHRRLLHGLSRWFTTSWRTTRRVFSASGKVGLPAWQMPFAWLAGLSFYSLAAVAQLAQAAGITSDRKEYVPDYAEHS